MSIDRSRFDTYLESHFSWAALVLFVILEAWFIALVCGAPKSWFYWSLIVAALIVYVLFFRLRVIIDEKAILMIYGAGFIEFEYMLSELQSITLVEDPTLKTLLYTPTCFEAVEIVTRESGRIRLPSKNRERLTQTLRARREFTV